MINKMKIQNADKHLKEKRFRQTEGYKKAVKKFEKLVKNPQTQSDLDLIKEQKIVQDCEELVRRMDKVFKKNELVKPAEVVNDQGFRMTDSISKFQKSKSANRFFESEAAEKKKARDTIAAFENLRLREKELEREEYLAKGR